MHGRGTITGNECGSAVPEVLRPLHVRYWPRAASATSSWTDLLPGSSVQNLQITQTIVSAKSFEKFHRRLAAEHVGCGEPRSRQPVRARTMYPS